jgi:hypothetical protein
MEQLPIGFGLRATAQAGDLGHDLTNSANGCPGKTTRAAPSLVRPEIA